MPERAAVEWELLPLTRRSVLARTVLGLVLTLVTAFSLAGCHTPLYYYTENQFAGRAIPPSGLQQRVLAAYTATGNSGGGAEILDGLRDLRSNVQNTHPAYFISGYSSAFPSTILNFPEQQFGYLLDFATGTVTGVNYATERSGTALFSGGTTLGADSPSVAISPDGTRAVGATATSGQILIYATGTQGGTYALTLPNVNRVVLNPGNSAILAMTRNSNNLYRIIQLPQTSTPIFPPGYVDCEPLLLPVYCIVPVAGNYDRPTNAYFSLDGSTAYVLNCGPECGGTTASVSVLQTSQITYNNIPTVNPLAAGAPTPLATLPVANPIPIPGGVTVALSDGSNLYMAGQSLLRQTSSGALSTTPAADGLFTGFLTTLPLGTYVPGNPVSVSDGTHTRLLFADNNTLWVGSNNCAVGERAHTGLNINCLTMVDLSSSTQTATVIPSVTPGGSTTVPYPNTNGNLYYYGDLTGICWVQGFNKVYTAYGGQIHAFYTGGAITNYNDPANGTTPPAGTEIYNGNITIQGTVLDVAYMDALTNTAN